MLGLRSALLLASACASTLCMAAPTPRSGPSGTTSYAGATIDSSRFPVQVKVPIGEGYLYTFDVINSIAIERPGMYFAPGPTGCFFDKGGQVTTDGNNSLPFGFDLYTKSLRALGVQAPTCFIAGCMPSVVPDEPLVFNITDNGLDYVSPCGTPPGWGTVSLVCGGPSATCSAGVESGSS